MAHSNFIKINYDPRLSVKFMSDEKNKWTESIRGEFDTLQRNDNLTHLNNHPPGILIISSGVILKINRDSAGKRARYMAHMVVWGNFQSYLVYYT